MSYVWGQTKADKVLREHGIRFDDAVRVFDDLYSWMQTVLYQGRDGVFEEQYPTVGIVDGRFITVVTGEDDDSERVITAWKSSREEIKGYFENLRKRVKDV